MKVRKLQTIIWTCSLLVSLPMFKYESRNPLAVVNGDYSNAIFGEIIVYFILANIVIWMALKSSLKIYNQSILMLLPIFFGITTFWSTTPLLTLVRASQLLILMLLINILIAIFQQSLLELTELYRTFNNFFITFNTILVLYSFIRPTFSSGGRLTYFNVHPIVSATVTGLVSIILVTMSIPKKFMLYRILILTLNLFFIFLNRSRGPLIALIVVIILVIFTTRKFTISGKLQFLNLFMIVGIFVSAYALVSLQNYLARGEELKNLNQLNGRIFLWTNLIRDNSIFTFLFGHGYGSERIAAFDVASWAGSSHSSWISYYYSGGITILLILFLMFLFTMHSGWKCRMKIPAMYPILFLTICSLTGDTFQIPNLITFGYFLYFAITLKERHSFRSVSIRN